VTKTTDSYDNISDKQRNKKVKAINNTERSKKNAHRNLSNEDIIIAKEKTTTATAIDVYNEKSRSSSSKYHNSSLTTFVTADKFDILIIKELLKDPTITTLEISLKLGISFSIAHRKRRLVESKVLHKNHFLDFKKLGLDFRIVNVFADIQEDNVNDCIKKLHSTFFAKNIIKVMRVKGGGDGICIKALFHDSKDLFFLIDKIRTFPFVSNVHFLEEVEVLGDNTLNVILNLLGRDP
jgi:DNA-binding Lrp family transcriptional regulator